MPEIYLVPINQDGSPAQAVGDLSATAQEVCAMNAKLYQSVGFNEPWVGYLALHESQIIGTCAFVPALADGRAEIAYFTFPEFEGQGFATQMVKELLKIAEETDPEVLIFAHTLPEPNASNSILKKQGFVFAGSIAHAEEGEVWEWQLNKDASNQ